MNIDYTKKEPYGSVHSIEMERIHAHNLIMETVKNKKKEKKKQNEKYLIRFNFVMFVLLMVGYYLFLKRC